MGEKRPGGHGTRPAPRCRTGPVSPRPCRSSGQRTWRRRCPRGTLRPPLPPWPVRTHTSSTGKVGEARWSEDMGSLLTFPRAATAAPTGPSASVCTTTSPALCDDHKFGRAGEVAVVVLQGAQGDTSNCVPSTSRTVSACRARTPMPATPPPRRRTTTPGASPPPRCVKRRGETCQAGEL